MSITIEKIAENEQVEYTGDVKITGSIGKNAVVIIKDGSLTVDGGIGLFAVGANSNKVQENLTEPIHANP